MTDDDPYAYDADPDDEQTDDAVVSYRTGPFPPQGLSPFERICAAMAFIVAIPLLILGVLGLFLGFRFWVALPPILGVIPAFVAWGIIKPIMRMWKVQRVQTY